MSSTSNPQNSTANGVLGQLGNLGQQIGNLGSSSGADKYGLGQWGQTKVDVGSLFGLGTDQQYMTLDDVMRTLLQYAASPDPAQRNVVAAVKDALYKAGDYGSTVPVLGGPLTSKDATTIANALILAGRTQGDENVDGQGNPNRIDLGQFLTNRATLGVANGADTVKQTVGTAEISLPNPLDVQRMATSAFQQALGRKPTPAEMQAFGTAFTSTVTGQEQANAQSRFDAQVAAAQGRLAQPQQTQSPAEQPAEAGPSFAPSKQGILDRQDQLQGALGPPIDAGQGFVGGVQNLDQQTPQTPAPELDTFTTQQQPGLYGMQQAAENYARVNNPQEAAVHDLAGQLGQFLTILRSHFGGQ